MQSIGKIRAPDEEAESVRTLVDRARLAQRSIESWPQERVDGMVAAVGWRMYEDANARLLASIAFRETQMGDLDETLERHRKRVLGTVQDLHGVRTVGCIESLPERGLRKIAKPAGVI